MFMSKLTYIITTQTQVSQPAFFCIPRQKRFVGDSLYSLIKGDTFRE